MLGRFFVLTNNHWLLTYVTYGQLMSSEILSIAFHVHISPAQLAILRFVPLIFSANPFLNSFQFLLRLCLPEVEFVNAVTASGSVKFLPAV